MASKSKSNSAKKTSASVVWFEVPADDLSRAKKFYGGMFGWKINAIANMRDYWHIDTSGPDASPDGGLMKRVSPEHQGITTYVSVDSVEKAAAKVEKLGGKICKPKTAVAGMGYFAICLDTENNVFALWERNGAAKQVA